MSKMNELDPISDKSGEDEVKEKKSVRSVPRMLSTYRRESNSNLKFPSSHSNDSKKNSSLSNDIETQTEWSWIQDMQIIERIRKEGADLLGEILNDIAQTDSEESEVESDAESKPSPKPTVIVESIGPPKILQYQPETKVPEVPPSPPLSIKSEPIENLGQFMQDFNVYIKGGQPCEFCGNTTKPWPSIEDQQNNTPETLHCCNDYQEFVEGLFQYQVEKEKLRSEDKTNNVNNNNNNNKSLEKESKTKKIKNAKARKLAEERAELRNMQRLLEKEQRMKRLANQKLEKQQQQAQLQAKQSQPANASVNANKINDSSVDESKKQLVDTNKTELDQINNKILHYRETSLTKAKKLSSKSDLYNSNMDTTNVSDTSYQSFSLSNQMRSINYQLSNLKYIQEGWTVRPRSPLDFDEMSVEEVEFNLTARTAASGLGDQNAEKPLIVRKYKNDNTCLILFPDGSGNVYYPSGKVALSITYVSAGMHIMTAFTDDEINQTLIASFDPFGNGSANYPNGKARLILSPLGGIELDSEGNRKKRWLWWDPERHVHAPPFQPLIFSLNNNLSVKVFSQDKININFYAENQVCKFRVGSKIELTRPDLMPIQFKIDPNEFYLKKKRSRIEQLIKLLNEDSTNLLKLPKIMNSRESLASRSKLNFDIFRLTEAGRKDLKKSSSKGASKFLTVP